MYSEIATITYRSGPEWEQRFGRRRRNITPPPPSPSSSPSSSSSSSLPSPPVLCPDFLIETYLDHQGEQFCLKYDANSLIYISKAMDLFDMSKDALEELEDRKSLRDDDDHRQNHLINGGGGTGSGGSGEVVSSTNQLTQEKKEEMMTTSTTKDDKKSSSSSRNQTIKKSPFISSLPAFHAYLPSLLAGLSTHHHPTLIIGVQSDTLFPIEQQRELAESLKANGNQKVMYFELNTPYGHDTFLLDVQNVGGALRGFLEQE